MTSTLADELHTAAQTVRGWVAEETGDPWAPTAITAFGPGVADRLDEGARNAESPDAITAQTVEFARAINGLHP